MSLMSLFSGGNVSSPHQRYDHQLSPSAFVFRLYDYSINHVSDFRYMNSVMASDECDLKGRKNLARAAFWKLQRLFSGCGEILTPNCHQDQTVRYNLRHLCCVAVNHKSSPRLRKMYLILHVAEWCWTWGGLAEWQMSPSIYVTRCNKRYFTVVATIYWFGINTIQS